MIMVKHVDSIVGSLLPIRLSTFKLVILYYIILFLSLNKVVHVNKAEKGKMCLDYTNLRIYDTVVSEMPLSNFLFF